MLGRAKNYDDLIAAFKWRIPERYNIGASVCDRWAEREPDRTAIIHLRTDGSTAEISYAALKEQSNRMANLLAGHGVGRGDRIGLLLPQTPETAVAHIATYKLGAIAVPLAMLFGVEALRYRLENAGVKILITTLAAEEKISQIRNLLPDLTAVFAIDGAGDNIADLQSAMERASSAFAPVDTLAEDPAMMIYTSGTTGPPKGALHAHRVLLGHLPGVSFAHEFLPRPGDRMWTPSDWAWAGGLLNVMLPALYFGVPVVAHHFGKFDPARAWAMIGDLDIRNAFIPPTALRLMRAQTPGGSLKNVALRTVFSGGEALGKGLQDWAGEVLNMKINEVFGQTECNLVLASCAAIGVWRPGAIGRIVPGHTVAVIDDDGRVLEAGAQGHIAVKRPDPVMFLEYWRRPGATAEKFAGDWLLTGDQGLMDSDGYVHFVGRDDDVITSAGYRIGPGEIEDCLAGHPAVKLAAAVGKPDPVRTEVIKAFIVLNEDFQPSEDLAAEIQAHVRTRLSAHEYPREIAFETDLPLTTTGKVIRRLLRDRA